MKFEKKYIRGVKDRAQDVVDTLIKAGGVISYADYSNFGDPTMLSYISYGEVISVSEDSNHGKLLKATCQEVFLAPIWKTLLTKKETELVDKIGDYIEENYGEIGAQISHEIKKMKNFCRCTECRYCCTYYGMYPDMESKRIICEKSEKTIKELSYEETNGNVGDCCNYEPR